MKKPQHTARHYRALLILLGGLSFLAASDSACAQSTTPLTLDDLLLRLEDNLRRYDAKVPSLFSDEHVISSRFPGPSSQVTTTDSIFRLKRILNPDRTTTLNESREVKNIGGHPTEAEDIGGPTIVIGAFSGGLAVVSSSQTSCMSYTFRPHRAGHARDPYVIHFKSLYNQNHPEHCLLREDGRGRVVIDPVTLQITRMELTAPQHVIFPARKGDNGNTIPPVVGEWILAVDYAPVLMGGQTFWLPSMITSHATTGSGGPDAIVWTFKARYSNYHKLEVTSRILPAESDTQ
jgi:hypothetical protein